MRETEEEREGKRETQKDRARRIGKGSSRQRDKDGVINGGCRENHKFRVHTLDASPWRFQTLLDYILRPERAVYAERRGRTGARSAETRKTRRSGAYPVASRRAGGGARQRLTNRGALNKYSPGAISVGNRRWKPAGRSLSWKFE